jgi:hypothetical protein
MTSARKIAANRANGRASRGPKTIQGKRRSSKNALRHGLSLPVSDDPRFQSDIQALAREIAGADDPCLVEQARHVAQAQIDLARIRRLRHELSMYADKVAPDGAADQPNAVLSPELLEQLIKLDRYERRTLSRRKTVIRRLMRVGWLTPKNRTPE